MYVPPAFDEQRPEFVVDFLAAHPLAQLVTMTPDGLLATPLPMMYAPESDGLGSLLGHVARPNPQWSQSLVEVEALAIFTGDGTYVSPNWYPSKAEHGRVVPTWNYETVHVRGRYVVHDDREWKRGLVTRLTEIHEIGSTAPWSVTDAPVDYIESMLNAIVGVEVRITSIQAKRKLSQNRPAADAAGVVEALAARGDQAGRVAAAMRSLSE